MRKTVAVRFRSAPRHYYFDPRGEDLKSGDKVIVETSMGKDIGIVVGAPSEKDDSEIVGTLVPIIRKATADDIETERANSEKKAETISTCKEIIKSRGLDMKLIDAEYTFGDNKLVFYFTSEERVDFRELVKDLASRFRTRIELRQIGVRDEARMLGGLGACGRELCCKRWLRDFEPVSIKMAKVQNLSLNPTKISGCCGRLMCCLKFENDIYNELKKDMPSAGEIVETTSGAVKIMDVNILTGIIRARYFDSEGDWDNPDTLSDELVEIDKSEIVKKLRNVKKNSGRKSRSGNKS
jgi:cell fate regulator YaaT (PSP1 superfamily)